MSIKHFPWNFLAILFIFNISYCDRTLDTEIVHFFAYHNNQLIEKIDIY